MVEIPVTVWGIATSRTLRVHWMLHEMEFTYQTRRILSRSGETQTPEYREKNPKQKIPCIECEGLILSESYAIQRFLRDRFGGLPYAADQQSTVERARRDEWASFIQMELDATSLYVMRRHRDLPEIYGAAENATNAASAYFLRQLLAVEPRIPSRGGYLWGSAFSEIDILMVSCLDWALHYGINLPASVLAYRDRMIQRPAYQAAFRFNYQA